MRRPASPSLFWTFAGAFLIVLIAGLAIQAMVLLSVVGPIAAARLRADAEAIVQRGATEVGRALEAEGARDPAQVLARIAEGAWDHPIVFIDSDGQFHANRPTGSRRRRLIMELARHGLLSRRPDRSDTASVPPARSDPTWEQERQPPPLRGPGPRGPGPRPGMSPGPGLSERLVVRAPVFADGVFRGEIVTLVPPRRALGLPHGIPRPGLFFLPAAALIAGVAGLFLFRALADRLRALEGQARRVARGDLTGRVPDLGKDEIGKLGVSLNEMTERLAESRQRLDEAEQQRRRFLADVTHELSTPLTSIRGYAETLLDPHVPVTAEERAAYLGHVLEESRRMDALLHDLLDLARLEAGVGETVRERIDLVALVRHATQRHAPRFAQAGLALHWKPESVASAGVDADGRRLEQVVDNLLANALRYVPRTGSVWVGVDVCDGAAEGPTGPPEVRLVVEDDGPGFPPGSLDSVFDRFYRADPSRPSGGTGLGLAIVKEIVLRHGGTVRASGRDEGGARIEVRLPSEGA